MWETARSHLGERPTLNAGITSLRARSDAVLRVTASMTVAEYLLPGWLTALRARDPKTTVNLTAGNSAEVVAAVLSGNADLGFVEGPDLPSGLASQHVGSDLLTVVVPPGHPWIRRRSGITAAELAPTPLVARERGSGTLHAVRVSGLNLTRRLLAVWAVGRQLTGPAADLRAIAARGVTRGGRADAHSHGLWVRTRLASTETCR